MSGEKTEQATPQRRKKARKDGQVAKSADFSGIVVLICTMISLVFWGPNLLRSLLSFTNYTLSVASSEPSQEQATAHLYAAIVAALTNLAPILATCLVAGLGVAYLQVGWGFSVKSIVPDASKMSPAEGIKRMLSKDRLVDLLKNSARLIIMGAIAWSIVMSAIPVWVSMTGQPLGRAAAGAMTVATSLIGTLTGTLLLFGVIDLLWQRHRHNKQLMMTKHEVREEYKSSEGDPAVKGKRKRLRQELLREASLNNVKSADAVIINPTHVAVAIRYAPDEMNAPTVVARGQGLFAAAVRKEAKKWSVPVVRNVPLARTLVLLELESEVPQELYEAVAEVLRFVYALDPEDP